MGEPFVSCRGPARLELALDWCNRLRGGLKCRSLAQEALGTTGLAQEALGTTDQPSLDIAAKMCRCRQRPYTQRIPTFRTRSASIKSPITSQLPQLRNLQRVEAPRQASCLTTLRLLQIFQAEATAK